MTIGRAGPQGQAPHTGRPTDVVIDLEIALHALADHIAAVLAQEYVELMEAAALGERHARSDQQNGGPG
jgi:hypothetical protein